MTSASELNQLLDACRPLTVLKELGPDTPAELMIYKAQALLYVDRTQEAATCSETAMPLLTGDDLALAKRIKTQSLLKQHRIDDAVLCCQEALGAAVSTRMRVRLLTLIAAAYSEKHCFQSAQKMLGDAKALAGPEDADVLVVEGGIKLAMDERLPARDFFDRLAKCNVSWAKYYADVHRSAIALLLGDFGQSRLLAESALEFSGEMPVPYYILAHLAEINQDVTLLENTVGEVAGRFPEAETLPMLQAVRDRLKRLQSSPEECRRRLKEFPTTMQKRDYCGPSAMDLILRFWKSSEEFTDDEIAAYVKLPHSGTPAYRMREFFHLVGFDTIRCLASTENLKRLVNAGFPVIVTAAFSETSHVSVVIGYDETTKTIEFQDPTTHNVLTIPEEAVHQVRKPFMNSAILAFPHGKGHDKELARLGFFDEPSIIWTDQAQLLLEKGKFAEAVELMERAVKRLPEHELSWILLLSAMLEEWRNCLRARPQDTVGLARFRRTGSARANEARKRFHACLREARMRFPESRVILQLDGRGALLDGRAADAVTELKQASELEGGDSRSYALLAESHFALRQPALALEAAQEALKRDPASPLANVWMARCLSETGKDTAEHYARCGTELSPDWWMSHLAMAEAMLLKKDRRAARQELAIAIGLEPEDPEARILQAILREEEQGGTTSGRDLRKALESSLSIPLRSQYNGIQALCKTLFTRREFREAQREVRKLLRFAPDDIWALQFLAATTAEDDLKRGRRGAAAGRQVRERYARPIEASHGEAAIVSDYLQYLARMEGPAPALQEAARIRSRFPENSRLLILHARGLMTTGEAKQAADLMLQALGLPGAIGDADALFDAVRIIRGAHESADTEQRVLEAPVPETGPALEARRRALGLVFTLNKQKDGPRAIELLEEALKLNPGDAFVALRLAEVLDGGERREELHRRAVRLAPGWPLARARLAQYLSDNGRAVEALEFVYGHQDESMEVMVAVSGALFNLGRYEEAISTLNAAMPQMQEVPSWIHGNQWLAETRNGDHDAALRTAHRALRAYPREVGWHLRMASSLRGMGRFAAASRETERARFQGLNWDGVLEGDYERAWDLGRFQHALEIVEKQIKREPKKEGRHLSEAEARKFRLLLELGSRHEAETLVDIQELDTAEAWHAPTWICMEARAWDLAADYARRLLAIDPQDFVGQFAQAEAFIETGHIQEGVQAHEALRAAYPREHHAYEKLAALQAMEGKLDDALELAERAVLLGEYCPFAWGTRGYVYFLRGQWDLARSDLEAAWKRADIDRKRHDHWYWWILASLQNKPVSAFLRQRRARGESKTSWDQQRLDQVRGQLRRTAGARFVHSYVARLQAWFRDARRFLSRAYSSWRGGQASKPLQRP